MIADPNRFTRDAPDQDGLKAIIKAHMTEIPMVKIRTTSKKMDDSNSGIGDSLSSFFFNSLKDKNPKIQAKTIIEI